MSILGMHDIIGKQKFLANIGKIYFPPDMKNYADMLSDMSRHLQRHQLTQHTCTKGNFRFLLRLNCHINTGLC